VVEGYTPEQVEEVRMVVRLLPVFFTTILYWTVYAQMGTFFIMQARCCCAVRALRGWTTMWLWKQCSRWRHGTMLHRQCGADAVDPIDVQGTQMERSMFDGKFFIPAASLSVSAGSHPSQICGLYMHRNVPVFGPILH
jgi:POT family